MLDPRKLSLSGGAPRVRPANAGSRSRRIAAWLVHLYTATGLLAAAGVAVAIVDGSPAAMLWAFVGLWAAMIIDSTDGILARRVDVKKILPEFDGRRLDDLTDFLTYTCLPLLLVWRARLVPEGAEPFLLVPLLASAYGFCQTDIKTEDGFFLGFPSYWNVIALYLYFLRPPAPIALAMLLVLALLTFVPTRYLYPSQRGTPLSRTTNGLGFLWAVAWGAMLFTAMRATPPIAEAHDGLRLAVTLSTVYPVYYFLASWVITVHRWVR
jgi:phosphatidylcholine synthase